MKDLINGIYIKKNTNSQPELERIKSEIKEIKYESSKDLPVVKENPIEKETDLSSNEVKMTD